MVLCDAKPASASAHLVRKPVEHGHSCQALAAETGGRKVASELRGACLLNALQRPERGTAGLRARHPQRPAWTLRGFWRQQMASAAGGAARQLPGHARTASGRPGLPRPCQLRRPAEAARRWRCPPGPRSAGASSRPHCQHLHAHKLYTSEHHLHANPACGGRSCAALKLSTRAAQCRGVKPAALSASACAQALHE